MSRTNNTRTILLRLKTRIGREKGRAQRLAETYRLKGDGVGLERAVGEATVLRQAQRFIDDELKRLGERA